MLCSFGVSLRPILLASLSVEVALGLFAVVGLLGLRDDGASAVRDHSLCISSRVQKKKTRQRQPLRLHTLLPHVFRPPKRVAVFAEGPAAVEAEMAGADMVAVDELIADVRQRRVLAALPVCSCSLCSSHHPGCMDESPFACCAIRGASTRSAALLVYSSGDCASLRGAIKLMLLPRVVPCPQECVCLLRLPLLTVWLPAGTRRTSKEQSV